MPRETIILDSEGEHWRADATMRVLGWLAYPASTEKDRLKRTEFRNHALAGWFRHLKDANLEWAMRSQMMPPVLMDISREKIDSVVGRAEKLICTKRLVAGQMLGTLLVRACLDGKSLPFEIEGKRPVITIGCRSDDGFRPASLNAIAEQMAEDINNADVPHAGFGHMDRAAVIRRIWMPAKPVAHLALALHGNIATECDHKFALRLGGNWLEDVLLKAEIARHMAIKATRISDDKTVKITLSEPPE